MPVRSGMKIAEGGWSAADIKTQEVDWDKVADKMDQCRKNYAAAFCKINFYGKELEIFVFNRGRNNFFITVAFACFSVKLETNKFGTGF